MKRHTFVHQRRWAAVHLAGPISFLARRILTLPQPEAPSGCSINYFRGGPFFFPLTGCGGSRGYRQSRTERETTTKRTRDIVSPEQGLVPVHSDQHELHIFCMKANMDGKEPKQEPQQPNKKPPQTKTQNQPNQKQPKHRSHPSEGETTQGCKGAKKYKVDNQRPH